MNKKTGFAALAASFLFFTTGALLQAAVPEIVAIGNEPVIAGTTGMSLTIPAGKTLVLSVTGKDDDNDALGFTASSSNPLVAVQIRNGYSSLAISSTFSSTSGTTKIADSGDMQFAMLREFAPLTTGIISGFANTGFYDGLKFHRIVSDFVIQGGDPNGNGSGGPPFTFANEFDPALIMSGTAQLAMANSGFATNTYVGTNGSQFFITLTQPRFLDFNHTIFGQATRGYDTIQKIQSVQLNGSTPASPVIMTSARIVPALLDGCVYLTASGTGTSTITITANDSQNVSTPITFTIQAKADTYNDPPYLNFMPDFTLPAGKSSKVSMQQIDLEEDPPYYAMGSTDSTPHVKIKPSTSDPEKFKITPKPKDYTGSANLVFATAQLDATNRGSTSDPFNYVTATAGIGATPIALSPLSFSGTAGQTFTSQVLAEFPASGTSAAGYSARVNWGDLTLSNTNVISVVLSGTKLQVVGTHKFTKPGIYKVLVDVFGPNGLSASTEPAATISSSDLVLSSDSITTTDGTFNGTVARFVDYSPSETGSYSARIQWGDGGLSDGTIQSSGTDFTVTGNHVYGQTGTYPLAVHLTEGVDRSSTYALAKVTGTAASGFPPLPQTRLVPIWQSLGQALSGTAAIAFGQVTVENCGTLPYATPILRFYYSTNSKFNEANDTLLTLGDGTKGIHLPAMEPGDRIIVKLRQTKKYNYLINIPTGAAGKYLFAVVDYSDPLGDILPITRAWGVQIPAIPAQ